MCLHNSASLFSAPFLDQNFCPGSIISLVLYCGQDLSDKLHIQKALQNRKTITLKAAARTAWTWFSLPPILPPHKMPFQLLRAMSCKGHCYVKACHSEFQLKIFPNKKKKIINDSDIWKEFISANFYFFYLPFASQILRESNLCLYEAAFSGLHCTLQDSGHGWLHAPVDQPDMNSSDVAANSAALALSNKETQRCFYIMELILLTTIQHHQQWQSGTCAIIHHQQQPLRTCLCQKKHTNL